MQQRNKLFGRRPHGFRQRRITISLWVVMHLLATHHFFHFWCNHPRTRYNPASSLCQLAHLDAVLRNPSSLSKINVFPLFSEKADSVSDVSRLKLRPQPSVGQSGRRVGSPKSRSRRTREERKSEFVAVSHPVRTYKAFKTADRAEAKARLRNGWPDAEVSLGQGSIAVAVGAATPVKGFLWEEVGAVWVRLS